MSLREDLTIPHTQEWELYHNSFSLCSKKLRVCLAELGIPYRSHPIDLIETGSYENVGRAYKAVNPAGLVPVLVHAGHPIYESHDEIVYAAAHAGERGRELLPGEDEPALRALVEEWVDKASLVGADPTKGTDQRAGHCIPGLTVPLFTTMVRYIPIQRILWGLFFHPNKERPAIFTLLKLAGIQHLTKLPPAMELITRSRLDMERHLDALAEQLEKGGGPWIAGERFTLADVSWVVMLDRVVEADWDELFWGEDRRPAVAASLRPAVAASRRPAVAASLRPAVAAYWQRLQARPSFESAIVAPRCRELLDGAADLKQAKKADPALRRALEGELVS